MRPSCLMAHLPADLCPVIEFAYVTGWRIASEVLPLEWRHVDFQGGEVRLHAGTTKNGEGHKTRAIFERYNIVSDGDLRTAATQLQGLTGTKKGQLGTLPRVGDSERS